MQKATTTKVLIRLFILIWALTLPLTLIVWSCRLTSDWSSVCVLSAPSILAFILSSITCCVVSQNRIIDAMRKHSPRGIFFKLFDEDEKFHVIKVKAHSAESPQEFEEAMMEACMLFYNEGYRVAKTV